MKKQKVPAFRSEAEEARWWYAHREELGRDLEDAARKGTLKTLSTAELLRRATASRVISIRLHEADLARLRRLAAQKRLPYQTYIKSLLHEALATEERRRARCL
jgi:predicted DNA binding CopG/RHH family protein